MQYQIIFGIYNTETKHIFPTYTEARTKLAELSTKYPEIDMSIQNMEAA